MTKTADLAKLFKAFGVDPNDRRFQLVKAGDRFFLVGPAVFVVAELSTDGRVSAREHMLSGAEVTAAMVGARPEDLTMAEIRVDERKDLN